MANAGELTMRIAGLTAAFMLCVAAPSQALTEADFLLDAAASRGFDVAGPTPDILMSTDFADFLAASDDPADNPAVLFTKTECFMYAGATGCQSSVPNGTGPYTGVTTWTVTSIEVPVPADGLMLFVGGAANGDFVPSAKHPNPPDYQAGSMQLFTGSGAFGGSTLAPLDEMLLSVVGVGDFVYYGARVSEAGDSLTFGYTVDEQLAGGTPILFQNAARNFTVVPEPGTAMLLGAGLYVLATRRKRS